MRKESAERQEPRTKPIYKFKAQGVGVDSVDLGHAIKSAKVIFREPFEENERTIRTFPIVERNED